MKKLIYYSVASFLMCGFCSLSYADTATVTVINSSLSAFNYGSFSPGYDSNNQPVQSLVDYPDQIAAAKPGYTTTSKVTISSPAYQGANTTTTITYTYPSKSSLALNITTTFSPEGKLIQTKCSTSFPQPGPFACGINVNTGYVMIYDTEPPASQEK
jgi:hypothetical protein